MAAPIVFPDAAALVCTYLREQLVDREVRVPVGTRVPSPRPARFVRIERIGGLRLDRVTDRPRLDVHCWGASEEDAHDLAQLVRALLLAIPGWRGAAAYDVAEVGGPNTLPDATSGQDRVALAVEIALRGKSLA
ncbi:tail terminator [Streptomyces phage SF1]|uniref:Tail terminator n=2 Tax=Caudoviricetes TaxID=2731619 RepID=A0A0K1Y5W8_9CAUD|nr:hypothetical protein [Streptomyces sp. SPB78]YP_009199280.1 tail terminator [Streptomyces phage SF1]YP_009213139.1 tail terminator [Streptomyces phage SF3]AKY02181.1 hypothetical protein SF1_320 [Streptomyces phage SF1]ALF00143.1 hypothetical protein SF3_120 [Streptomyces phage SF3]EFL00581.1 conserved hypothetical protein [Streptomyces sp. SPB78]